MNGKETYRIFFILRSKKHRRTSESIAQTLFMTFTFRIKGVKQSVVMFLYIKEVKHSIIKLDKQSNKYGFWITKVRKSRFRLDKQKYTCFIMKRVRQSLTGQFQPPSSGLKGLSKPY